MCDHDMLRDTAHVVRCGVHSRPSAGVSVWTWSTLPVVAPVAASCPCLAADRFVVAHESASGRWLSAADVVVAAPRDTTSAAVSVVDRLGRLPGCVVVFVPLVGGGAVAGRGTAHTVVRRTCPACVYPLLVCGGDLS